MNNYLEEIDAAFELNQEGKLKESEAILSGLVDTIPSGDVKSLGLVGSLLRESKNFEGSLKCFLRALSASPDSERASLGLFHSLWGLERFDEALDEMQRFLGTSRSEEHTLLLAEMNEGFFGPNAPASTDDKELIRKIRATLG